jgi:serine/threonine protein kinase/tricorn protease-like protein
VNEKSFEATTFTMTPERWQQIKNVFNSALKYEPGQRSSFLSEACHNDSALQNEVESLLAAHEKDGSFIDSPAYEAADEIFAELKPGEVVGSYEITSFIGRGGMGEVYLAHDKRLRRKVALKLLPSSLTKDVSRLHRFEQEARAASALNHPNIIAIYEICEVNSSLMMAAEFVEGETLRHRLTFRRLDLTEILTISIQIADALSSAHKAGIVHRDIKPENIMIRPDGYVKVLDFGLAKLSEPDSAELFTEASTQIVKTGSGVVIGTVGYMSPEQARGQEVDARSDIFNLGAVIYEMVAGHKPFAGDTPGDTFAAILKLEPPPLSRVAPETPAELVRIVTKALRKDREERYQVVKDLLLDLKSLKEEIDFHARLDRSVKTTSQPKPETHEIKTPRSSINDDVTIELKLNKTRAFVIGIALLLLLIAGGIGLYKLLNRTAPLTADAPHVLKQTQVTFSSGLDVFPALSPDGRSVAYASDQNGNFEIYVKQLASGGGELQLTNDGQQNLQPSWSPDGQRIAYYSKRRGGIWVMSALGGAPKQITETGCSPAWSPDGSMIAFQSGELGEIFTARTIPPSTIWIVPSQGGTPKQISQPGNPRGGHAAPSWSPDGKRIAFQVADFIFGTVWTMAADGSELKKIGNGADPTYAGDGHLYFSTGHSGGGELSRIRVSPLGDPIGEPAVVVDPGQGTYRGSPTVSRDGKFVLYSVNRFASNLWTIPLLANGDAAGPPSPFLPDTSLRTNLPRFSSDGRRVALNRWRPGMSADIWVADADGKNLTQVTNNPATDSQASWLPGGDKLAFLSSRNNNHLALWTTSLTTGKEEPLLDLGEGIEFATVSPDGTQVAYNFTQNGVVNIWVAQLRDGQRRQLTFEDQMGGFPTWSPDGQWIAYEKKGDQNDYLMLIPSKGGEATQLTFDKGKSWPHGFSPSGDKIVFAGQRDGAWNIYSISIASKVQKQLTNYSKLNAFARYPAWAPNQIVYEYAVATGNIWMLELK